MSLDGIEKKQLKQHVNFTRRNFPWVLAILTPHIDKRDPITTLTPNDKQNK